MTPGERLRRYQELDAEAQQAAIRGDRTAVGRLVDEMAEVWGTVDPAEGLVDVEGDRRRTDALEAADEMGPVLVAIRCVACRSGPILGVVRASSRGPVFDSARALDVEPEHEARLVAEARGAGRRLPFFELARTAVLLSLPRSQFAVYCRRHGAAVLDLAVLREAVDARHGIGPVTVKVHQQEHGAR